METILLNKFREDLRAEIAKRKIRQKEIEKHFGVSQGTLSNFLQSKRGISVEAFIRLWPFVYGETLLPHKRSK